VSSETPRVCSTPQHVSVSLHDNGWPAGVAEASDMYDGSWFVNRVLVPQKYRGQGRGKLLVSRLLDEVTKQGCNKLVLTPGGYDLPYEQQEAFYLKCGFRVIEKGLMEYP
jgi:GNAT superfamily N-acetyltransferase